MVVTIEHLQVLPGRMPPIPAEHAKGHERKGSGYQGYPCLPPLQPTSMHISFIVLPIQRFSFLPGTLRCPGEQCWDQGCPAAPVCSELSYVTRQTLNILRHSGLAHPHFKELTCPWVRAQCQPSWLGSSLSSRTQSSPAQPGMACLLYLGAVAHTTAQMHLQ